MRRKIKDYLEKIPSSKSKGYGKPFNDIFKEAGYDFYKIDTSLFSPAEVVINEALRWQRLPCRCGQ